MDADRDEAVDIFPRASAELGGRRATTGILRLLFDLWRLTPLGAATSQKAEREVTLVRHAARVAIQELAEEKGTFAGRNLDCLSDDQVIALYGAFVQGEVERWVSRTGGGLSHRALLAGVEVAVRYRPQSQTIEWAWRERAPPGRELGESVFRPQDDLFYPATDLAPLAEVDDASPTLGETGPAPGAADTSAVQLEDASRERRARIHRLFGLPEPPP
jgi:hypothetical protein